MGLDMYLERDTYIKNWDHNGNPWTVDIRKNGVPLVLITPSTITEEIGYWRKANHIHRWFVEHVQDGVDNCQRYYVSEQKLKDLLDTCKAVLEDHDLAPKLLPTKSGFFFGGTEYDEWYFRDVADTVKILTDALASTDWNERSIYYNSSW